MKTVIALAITALFVSPVAAQEVAKNDTRCSCPVQKKVTTKEAAPGFDWRSYTLPDFGG